MRLYRALLHLYPSSFQAEYGREMWRVFAKRYRDASGPAARADAARRRGRRHARQRRDRARQTCSARTFAIPSARSPTPADLR